MRREGVWPADNGRDGEVSGIYVYDPATNAWAIDTQVPSYGNFIGNSGTSLHDARVAFAGANFGRQQTHIWFYQAECHRRVPALPSSCSM